MKKGLPVKNKVAVLLAAGPAAPSLQSVFATEFKCLVPYEGRPIVEHTLAALHAARFEKVFIVHHPKSRLDKMVTPDDRNIFLPSSTMTSTMTSSILYGIYGLSRHYSPNELLPQCIAIVPGDLPLAEGLNFNNLILNPASQPWDVRLPLIEQSLLSQTWPRRHFNSMYFRDLKATYTWQNVILLKGKRLILPDRDSHIYPWPTIHGIENERLAAIAATIEHIRRHRHSHRLRFNTIIAMTKLLYTGRQYLTFFAMVIRLLCKQMTLAKLDDFLTLVTGLRINHFLSREVALSYDIDELEDLHC